MCKLVELVEDAPVGENILFFTGEMTEFQDFKKQNEKFFKLFHHLSDLGIVHILQKRVSKRHVKLSGLDKEQQCLTTSEYYFQRQV
jgi:hypothetical protein